MKYGCETIRLRDCGLKFSQDTYISFANSIINQSGKSQFVRYISKIVGRICIENCIGVVSNGRLGLNYAVEFKVSELGKRTANHPTRFVIEKCNKNDFSFSYCCDDDNGCDVNSVKSAIIQYFKTQI